MCDQRRRLGVIAAIRTFVACRADEVHARFGHQTVVFYDCLFSLPRRAAGTGLLARMKLRRYKPATLILFSRDTSWRLSAPFRSSSPTRPRAI
jgi:hypothetical protein